MVIKRFFALALILALCACSSVTAEFKPPVGFLVSSYKAPLTIKAENIKIGRAQQRKYITSFFWLPIGIMPPVSTTSGFNKPGMGEYADYEYFSILGGMFQFVSVIPYNGQEK